MNIDQQLLTIIFEFSESRQQHVMSSVCRRWHRASMEATQVLTLADSYRKRINPQRMNLKIELRNTNATFTPETIYVCNTKVNNYDSDGWTTRAEFSSSDLTQVIKCPMLASNPNLRYLTFNGFDRGACGLLCQLHLSQPLEQLTLRFAEGDQPSVGDVMMLCTHVAARRLKVYCPASILPETSVANIDAERCAVSHLSLETVRSNLAEAFQELILTSLVIRHLMVELPSSLEFFASHSLKFLSFYQVSGAKGTSLELNLHNFPSLESCEIANCHCLTGIATKGPQESIRSLFISDSNLFLYGECSLPNAKVMILLCRTATPFTFRCNTLQMINVTGKAITGPCHCC